MKHYLLLFIIAFVLFSGITIPFEWDSRDKVKILGMENKGFLAENMVYDSTTKMYFIIFSDYSTYSIGLIYSHTPKDSKSWHYGGIIIDQGFAPHILRYNGKWNVVYGDNSNGNPFTISIQSSEDIFGEYGDKKILLKAEQPWEHFRVDEPFVFRFDDKWGMLYMGWSDDKWEQVGLATSDSLMSGWVKSPLNPIIRYGETYDKGTIADPWCYQEDDIYHIGYSCSETQGKPWQTAIAITKHFEIFEKRGLFLTLGDDFDKECSFRGSLVKFDNTLYFPYTGRSKGEYNICLAYKNL